MAMGAAQLQPKSTQQSELVHRWRWRIAGRVQGVGFRPFVYRIANAHSLTGFVLNDSAGVIVEAQGNPDDLHKVNDELHAAAPRLAVIQNSVIEDVPIVVGESGFIIRTSDASALPQAEIAPDLAICDQCTAELRDPSDIRRFGYGLVNCTACGPRFSIVCSIPYDRPNTTMAPFAMCTQCREEYEQPADRRFHAQPTACKTCGPIVELADTKGQPIAGDPIQHAAERLLAGQIIAIKGVGGFHLAARADDDTVIDRLRELKHRSHKPFALMVASTDKARRIIALSKHGERLIASPAAPIVLGRRCQNSTIAPAVAPGSHRLGVIVAYTPIHHLIFDALRGQCPALVMTSANDSDEPLVFTNEEAVARLGTMCDAILWHHRPIQRPVDDSVVIDVEDREPLFLRRSRGYVPTPVKLPGHLQSTGICVGGELKSIAAVVRGKEVMLSQHLGDLENVRSYVNFKLAVDDLVKLFSIKPQWVAHDMHPTYLSTTYAKLLAQFFHVPTFAFQHHHAHAAAVLAEHGLSGPALAVICDGTGFGTDGKIWGGELLVVNLKTFKRLAHLRPMLLPGGDAASKQPWRCAMSLLRKAFGDTFADLPIISQIAPDQRQGAFVAEMLQKHVGCASSTAAGRLFDGIAAILSLATENHFEAQAPLALESAAAEFGDAPKLKRPLFEVHSGAIDFSPLVRDFVARLQHKASIPELAAIFHEQFAAAWEAVVMQAVEQTGLVCVGLSGGVMCNQIVDRLLTDRLTQQGLHVLRHRLVPPNDGGLALGQAALAAYRAAHG